MEKKDKLFAYARCSTKFQDVEYEKRALINYGVKPENIFIEYESGAKTKEERPIYNSLLETLSDNPKSTLVVTDLTRICRNKADLHSLISFIDKYQLRLCITTNESFQIDCRTEEMSFIAGLLLYFLGYLGVYELRVKHAQIKLGMENSRAKGIHIGRPKMSIEKIDDDFFRFYTLYKQGKLSISELSRISNKSRNTVYSYIKLIKNNQKKD